MCNSLKNTSKGRPSIPGVLFVPTVMHSSHPAASVTSKAREIGKIGVELSRTQSGLLDEVSESNLETPYKCLRL